MQLHVVHDVNLLAPATQNSLYISNRKRGSGRRNRLVFSGVGGSGSGHLQAGSAYQPFLILSCFLLGTESIFMFTVSHIP
jgi:hypothetical protein